MLRVAAFATVAALANGATYQWNKNNNWGDASNWATGAGSGAVNLNVDCISNFGTGAELKVDAPITVSSIDLAMNMEIILGADITFDESSSESSDWRCKAPEEYSASCPSNYLVNNGTADVVPDRAPCSGDTLSFDRNDAMSVVFSGSFVRDIVIENAGTADAMSALNSVYDTVWIGALPEVNSQFAPTENFGCPNTCPRVNPSSTNITGEDRYSEAGQIALNRTIQARDRASAAADAVIDVLGSPALNSILTADQTAYLASINITQEEYNSLPRMVITLPVLTAGGMTMGTWMEAAGVGSSGDITTIKYATTRAKTDNAVSWMSDQYVGGGLPVESTWSEILGSPQAAAAAVASLNNGEASIPVTSEGDLPASFQSASVPSAPSASSPADQAITEFLTAYSAGTANSLGFNFIRGNSWGTTSSAPLDPNADFDFAPGAFQFSNVQVVAPVYVSDDGVTTPAIAPSVAERLMAAATAVVTLHVEEQTLTQQIDFISNITTLPPAAASADDDSGGMLIIIAAAAGAALLCCIIIIVVLLRGGSGDGGKNEARNVVAFENPMYDDPSGGMNQVAATTDGELYDEPAFQDKSNPMYSSQENTAAADGAGYLDVNPDDEDDEDDDDEDDE